MKRNILFAFAIVLTVSVQAMAQQSNAAEAVYDKWRQSASVDEVSKTHFALAVVTRRTGEEVAEVDLWVVGRSQEAVIDFQPMYVEKHPTGEYKQELAGPETKTSVGNSNGEIPSRDNLGLKVIVPVKSNANAIVIKWVGYGDGVIKNSHEVQLLLLRDKPSENLTRVSGN